jgi:hypothetical protein
MCLRSVWLGSVLTRAINRNDLDQLVTTIRAAVREWNQPGDSDADWLAGEPRTPILSGLAHALRDCA